MASEPLLIPETQDICSQDSPCEIDVSEMSPINENHVTHQEMKPCDQNILIDHSSLSKPPKHLIEDKNSKPKAKRAKRAYSIFDNVSPSFSSYKCDQCHQEFKRESALKNHKLLNHDSEEESGNESDMGEPKGFSRTLEDLLASEKNESLPKKNKLHSSPQSKARKVKCTHEGCKQTFRSKSQLKTHLQKHTDKRNEEVSSSSLHSQSLKNLNVLQINNNNGTVKNSHLNINNGLPESSSPSIIPSNDSEKFCLHNYLQQNNKSLPKYEIRDFGLGLEPRFVCECRLPDYDHTAIGKSASMLDAQKMSIKNMLRYLVRSGFVPVNEIPQSLLKEFLVQAQNLNNNSHLLESR